MLWALHDIKNLDDIFSLSDLFHLRRPYVHCYVFFIFNERLQMTQQKARCFEGTNL